MTNLAYRQGEGARWGKQGRRNIGQTVVYFRRWVFPHHCVISGGTSYLEILSFPWQDSRLP